MAKLQSEIMKLGLMMCRCWIMPLMLLFASSAMADLLPTYKTLLEERVRRNPDRYDHADAFCRGKNLNDPCVIAGTALEGGGDGKCRRRLDGWRNRFIAECELLSLPQIDRKLPESTYELSTRVCEDFKPKPGEPLKDEISGKSLSCETVPMVSDRFCVDRKPGDACTAQLIVNGNVVENAGVCQLQTDSIWRDQLKIMRDERHGFVYYREEISRPSLLCLAKSRVDQDIRPSRPPGLLDWFHWPW